MRTSLFIVLSASLLVAGCGTHCTAVTTVPVETVVRDTVRLSSMRYDSIFVSNDVYTDRSRDTVLVRERTIEHRYRVLRDTVRLVRRDSVPYEVRVTEYRDIPRRPNSLAMRHTQPLRLWRCGCCGGVGCVRHRWLFKHLPAPYDYDTATSSILQSPMVCVSLSKFIPTFVTGSPLRAKRDG